MDNEENSSISDSVIYMGTIESEKEGDNLHDANQPKSENEAKIEPSANDSVIYIGTTGIFFQIPSCD